MNIKELNHKIYLENFDGKDKLFTDRSILEDLYAIHAIIYNFLEDDEVVRDKILSCIRREQKRLENKVVK